MSDDDLIRRGDAEKAMLPFVHNVIADDAIAAIRALPAALREFQEKSDAEA